jgi:hypothetical protein
MLRHGLDLEAIDSTYSLLFRSYRWGRRKRHPAGGWG